MTGGSGLGAGATGAFSDGTAVDGAIGVGSTGATGSGAAVITGTSCQGIVGTGTLPRPAPAMVKYREVPVTQVGSSTVPTSGFSALIIIPSPT